jgi:hypothetical protein
MVSLMEMWWRRKAADVARIGPERYPHGGRPFAGDQHETIGTFSILEGLLT